MAEGISKGDICRAFVCGSLALHRALADTGCFLHSNLVLALGRRSLILPASRYNTITGAMG